MKQFEYERKAVSILIPSEWAEKEREDGEGVFYDDRPRSGTFRIRARTYNEPEGNLTPPALGDMVVKIRWNFQPYSAASSRDMERAAAKAAMVVLE